MSPLVPLRRILSRLLPALLVLSLVPAAAVRAQEDEDINNPRKVEKQARKAIERDPDDPDNWYNLGLALILQERFDEAVEATERAVELNPENARAQFRAGEALAGAGKPDQAVPYFRRAAELDPTLAAAQARLGDALLDAGQFQEAIDAYKQALRARPDDPSGIYNNIGDAYFRLRDFEQATRWFSRTVEANPDDALAHFNLAVLFRNMGREETSFLTRAADEFVRASELAPDDPRTRFLTAETLIFIGREDAARPHLDAFFRLDPEGRLTDAQTLQAAREYRALLGG